MRNIAKYSVVTDPKVSAPGICRPLDRMIKLIFATKMAQNSNPVSLSLHHSHPCIIYEVNMRHIQDKYDAVMKQISIFFSKYEVLSTAIFKYCQNIIKLLLLIFKYTVGKPYPIIALNVHFC